jgi:lipopolysaccharide/colanic/teichoic acid biosynthesis glycosyltransferase
VKLGADGEVYINGKKCAQNQKPIITAFLMKHGATAKGKKADLCKRIHDILVHNSSLEIVPNAVNRNPVITSVRLKDDGEVYINGKRCAQNPKPIIVAFLKKHGEATKGFKPDLCKRIHDMVVRDKTIQIV